MRLGQVVQTSCLTPCDVCPGTVSPAVRTCIGCELSYCKDCLERTHGNDGLGHCLVKPEDNVESEMPRCRQHGQLVELFCQTDGVPVCLECLQTGRHKGHNATSMEDWANKEQKRHEARAHRKRARHESDVQAAEDTDETLNDIESVNKVVKHPPNEQRRSVHPPLTSEGHAYDDRNSHEVNRPNDIATGIRGEDVDYLSREDRPVGLNYSIRGETSVPHPSTVRERVKPVVRSVKDVTTPEIAAQHLPRERQKPARGCLSTGQIRTHARGDAKELLRPPLHNGFNDTAEDHFYKPQDQRVVEAPSSVSASSSGPYYISCREEVVGPVVFNNAPPTPLRETVADSLHQQQSEEKQPTRRGYQNTDQRVVSGDSYYRDQASSLLDNNININSSKTVNTGAESSQKHPGNVEQRFGTRYQGTGHILAEKEASISSKRTQTTVERNENHSSVTPGNLYLIEGPKLPTKDDVATTATPPKPTPRRQQQDYRARSREQANKDVQRAVQDMFTKYMVTGHGLATMEQQQPAPAHNSTDTNNRRSPAISRPARKLLGISTETKASRIAHAVEIANNPALEKGRHGSQSQSTSKPGVQSGTVEAAMKEPSTRPIPKPRGSTNTTHGQKYTLKVSTAEEDRETPRSQNNVGFVNVTDTGGVKPVETEAVVQYPLKQPGANQATATSSSGQKNRLDDSDEQVRVNTHTTVSAPSSTQPTEKFDNQPNMGKVLDKPNAMDQGMGTFKARSSLRLSGRRGKPSSRDVPSHPKSVNMAMSIQDTSPTKLKRQDPRNGGVMTADRTDRRQPTAAPRGSDSSLAVRIARVLPQRRETSDGSQIDITAQSSLPKIIPSLCGVGHTWITLRWTVSEVENYKAYQVQYQKHGGPVAVTPFRYGSTRETIDNLSPGTTYTMQVRALDMEGLVHCSNQVEMKTSSRRLAVPAQAETAARLRQAVQQARESKGQEAKSKKPSRWGLSHLTASFRRKKKKSATSESDTESKAPYTDVRRSSIDSQESEISTVSTISRTSRKSQKRVHFKEEDIAMAYDIKEMQALYPELSNVEPQLISDDVALPESTKQVHQKDHRTNEEREGKADIQRQQQMGKDESIQQADVQRQRQVSSPVFMTLMDQGEESEAETFKRVADNVRGTLGMSIRKVSVEVQTNEGGVFRPAAIRTSTARGSGGDNVSKQSDRSTEWEANVPLDTKGEGFRNVKRERTWQEIIEEDYDPKEGWKNVQVGDKMRFIDLEAIKPYRKVLTHAGYYGDKSNAIVVFSSCYMPNNSLKDYEYIMENLFLYILSFLDKVVDEEYKIVFLNYTKERSNLPSVTWLKSCYDHIDAKFKKKLKGLFIVHPTMWLKMLVHVTKPFVSSKFSKKLQFVDNFKDLQKQLPVDPEAIPEDVKKFEEELVESTANKGGTFAALKAALGREVQTGSVPENAFCAPYNKGLSSNMWEGFPTLRL